MLPSIEIVCGEQYKGAEAETKKMRALLKNIRGFLWEVVRNFQKGALVEGRCEDDVVLVVNTTLALKKDADDVVKAQLAALCNHADSSQIVRNVKRDAQGNPQLITIQQVFVFPNSKSQDKRPLMLRSATDACVVTPIQNHEMPVVLNMDGASFTCGVAFGAQVIHDQQQVRLSDPRVAAGAFTIEIPVSEGITVLQSVFPVPNEVTIVAKHPKTFGSTEAAVEVQNGSVRVQLDKLDIPLLYVSIFSLAESLGVTLSEDTVNDAA